MDFICELTQGLTDNTWIGGKMGAFEYEWTDGSEFDYINWADGEPNYGGEYIEMIAGNCKWNDVESYEEKYYICKKPI